MIRAVIGWPMLGRQLLQAAVLLGMADAVYGACTFRASPGGIAFGVLDPSIAAPMSAFTNVLVRCTPPTTPTWTFTGANGNAPLRMKHTVQSAYIAYSVSPTLISSSGPNQTWRVTANVTGASYVNAVAGSYSDTLTATILP